MCLVDGGYEDGLERTRYWVLESQTPTNAVGCGFNQQDRPGHDAAAEVLLCGVWCLVVV